MPTYVYRREDGTTFEVQQRITEPALVECPETGQKVSRVISANAGLIFKGSGFYLTDYARKSNGQGSDGSKSSEAATNGESGKQPAEPTSSKPESAKKSAES